MSTSSHTSQTSRTIDVEAGDKTVEPKVIEEQRKDPHEVAWDGPDDPQCPLNKATWRKWTMVMVLAMSALCVTCCSSMAGSTYSGMEVSFGVSQLVCVLSISLFVFGLGTGPLLLGPASEFIGRAPVLHWSFTLFFLLNFPVAFGNHISVHLIFRFLTGFAGSAFLSVSGGTITDIYINSKVATPMMIFSTSPFLGPVLGPLLGGFINYQQPDWRWTYYVLLIWSAACLVLLFLFVPETFDPQLLKRKAKKLRKSTGDDRYYAPIEKTSRSFKAALNKSIKTPFILLTTQPMVLFLDLWSAVILGILYLSFGGIPFIFRTQHNFNLQSTGMAFLGIGAGQLAAVATQPLFNRKYRATAAASPGGIAPPESRLIMGMYGAILCPLGLVLLGLTSFKSIHWIVPIILSSLFGMGATYSQTAAFTFLVDAYRPVSASALASNSFLRSSFAGGFPLFGQQMYHRLGAVGGTCLLAGLLVLCAPLPFVFYRIGERVRLRSPFGSK